MKDGLDLVRSKVQALTLKVKENQFPTAHGLSYLDAKNFLLLSYCQCVVYYLLRKAKGLSIEGHPVVRSLVEIRLFLEKIRTIDKKQDYQIQKYIRGSVNTEEKEDANKEQADTSNKPDDLLRYRPHPDMITPKSTYHEGGDKYVLPKFAPTAMDEEKVSKSEKLAQRRDKQILRQANQSTVMRDILNDMEGKPEEVREVVGAESREAIQYREKMNKRARQEEEIFTRIPLTKAEKKQGKHLKKSRNGLVGLSEDFYGDVSSLPLNGDGDEGPSSFSSSNRGGKKQFKRKRRH
ncbi:neuroguidin-like isoform X2 [Papaver somniferum]|nr:neuroguidin-like isoform X2 [Papaver somniferum]